MPIVTDLFGLPDLPPILSARDLQARLADLGTGLLRAQAGGRRSGLAALGMFVFGIDQLAHDELVRRRAWRHAQTERFGARPASQYVGPGEDEITLSGVLVPELAGSRSALATLAAMADAGDAHVLIDGDGSVFGSYVIRALSERRGALLPDGTPRRIAFDLDLGRVGD